MPDQSPLQHHALTVAQNITNIFRHDDLSTIALCRKEAQKVIGEITDSKVYDDSGNSKQLPQVWAIGNCHIDTGELIRLQFFGFFLSIVLYHIEYLQSGLPFAQPGFGHFLPRNRKRHDLGLLSLVRPVSVFLSFFLSNFGRLKLQTSWKDTPNIVSLLLKPNSSSG